MYKASVGWFHMVQQQRPVAGSSEEESNHVGSRKCLEILRHPCDKKLGFEVMWRCLWGILLHEMWLVVHRRFVRTCCLYLRSPVCRTLCRALHRIVNIWVKMCRKAIIGTKDVVGTLSTTTTSRSNKCSLFVYKTNSPEAIIVFC